MPIAYQIDKAARLIVEVYEGELTFADLMALNAQITKDPERDMNFNVLSDLSNARLRLTGEEVRKRAKFVETLPRPKQRRWAILASRDHEFGIARMTEMLLTELSTDYRVFRDRDKALEWLAGMGDEDSKSTTAPGPKAP